MNSTESENEDESDLLEVQLHDERELLIDMKIETCIQAFEDIGLGENLEAFKNSVRGYIRATHAAFKPPSDPFKVILNTNVNCGSCFETEAKMWLAKISSRLNGRTRIRNPYQGEIVRNIPVDLFLCLRKAITHTRDKSISDHVCFGENKKGYVLSFTSKPSVITLFSKLTSLTEIEVKSYLKKSLSGRINGRSRVIVSPEKDFAFIFKIKPSELHINFHYGVWNKAGFAIHNK